MTKVLWNSSLTTMTTTPVVTAKNSALNPSVPNNKTQTTPKSNET